MGVYLSQPITDKQTKTQTLKGVRYTSCEMQGWRKNMEDAKICQLDVKLGNKSYRIFAVFDGHGGTEVSKFVEAHFVEELLKNQEFIKGNIKAALEQNFRKMDEMLESPDSNRELYDIQRKSGSDSHGGVEGGNANISNNAGCTANVLVFDQQNYYVANSGDSRAALCRKGKLVVLSEDHKPECNIERTRIERAGGAIINGRVNGGLNLTRALGDLEYKKTQGMSYKQQMVTCHPDVITVPRNPDDQFIIMGCDGIWQRYVNDSQLLIDYLVDERKKTKDSKAIMEGLLDNLLAKSTCEEIGCDNMTSILIEFVKP